VAGHDAVAPAAPPAVLRRLMGDEARRTRDRHASSIHLLTDSLLGRNAALSVVQFDQRGTAVAIYGLVAAAREIGRALFSRAPDRATIIEPDDDLAPSDTLSVQVVSAEFGTLFGTLDSMRTATATVHPGGPLEGLNVRVALGPQAIGPPLAVPLARDQLWLNGLLLMCTALVIAIAAGSSRRETLLARARSDFIAGVSHDLRMPLAQILLAGETLTLKRDRDEKDRLGLANSIVRETRRLIALVENVLLFSRAGAVEIRPTLRPHDVDELFADAIEAVQLAADDAGQTITVHPAPSVRVLGDRQLIRQALVNLIDNALKYGARGQRVVLSARRHSPSLVRLWVEDQGPGVPRPERFRVFEPYERLARDQVSERTGTGLGLSVVHHIARVSEGRVWLEDAEGGGTRAVLELRSAESPEFAVPAPADG
jgi:signal transduction histidine kinase